MNFSEIKYCDIANGIGVRTSLFVSGCRRHCPGCFNECTWPFDSGSPYTKETENAIIESLKPGFVRGISLLGGEPFEPENQGPVLELLRRVRKELPEKDVWCYTGFTFEELSLSPDTKSSASQTGHWRVDTEKEREEAADGAGAGSGVSRAATPIVWELLRMIDVLVDGPFILDKKDISLAFRGSSNQRILNLPATLREGKIVLWEEGLPSRPASTLFL